MLHEAYCKSEFLQEKMASFCFICHLHTASCIQRHLVLYKHHNTIPYMPLKDSEVIIHKSAHIQKHT